MNFLRRSLIYFAQSAWPHSQSLSIPPAPAFSHPSEILNHPDLTLNEKRAILASWASDACAVEAAPALRRSPNGGKPVTFDDVMDALRALDQEAREKSGGRAAYKLRHGIGGFADRLRRNGGKGSGGGLGSPGALN